MLWPVIPVRMAHYHIIGAGMAGLAAAVQLAASGRKLTLYEAAPQAGGRCRSYHDTRLNRVIDNGTHLLLGCNTALLHYLDTLAARDTLQALSPEFTLYDSESGRRHRLRLPWSLPGSGWRDVPALLRLLLANKEATVHDVVRKDSAFFRQCIEPLTLAVLNTPPHAASAYLLGRVLRIALTRRHGTQPFIAKENLAAGLVQPALDFLRRRGTALHFNRRLTNIETTSDTLTALHFGADSVKPVADDRVILALPAWQVEALLPDIEVPGEYQPIINGHFVVPETAVATTTLTGILGATAEWLLLRPGLVSTTTSAAKATVGLPADILAEKLWLDIAPVVGLPEDPVPPCRIIKEKRATFAATPQSLQKRPANNGTCWRNLLLAGDYTATGLPATIEGAVLSGQRAATLASCSQV